MKLNRWAVSAVSAITTVIFMLILSGCGGGGEKTHNLDSPYRGDLYGVETQPADQETNVAVDSWIRVYWPHANYPPPATFTVSVEKEESPNQWGAIHTIQSDSSDPTNGEWWFEPANQFSTDTWYKIIVKDDIGRTSTSYFYTVSAARSGVSGLGTTPQTTTGKAYKPTNAKSIGGEGALEHVIKTGK